jgi:hypothetical protein
MQAGGAKRDALLFRQFHFLNTRMVAFESVVLTARFWERVRFLLNPVSFMKTVDKVQMQLLRDAEQEAAEAAKKPKLTVVGANGR